MTVSKEKVAQVAPSSCEDFWAIGKVTRVHFLLRNRPADCARVHGTCISENKAVWRLQSIIKYPHFALSGFDPVRKWGTFQLQVLSTIAVEGKLIITRLLIDTPSFIKLFSSRRAIIVVQRFMSCIVYTVIPLSLLSVFSHGLRNAQKQCWSEMVPLSQQTRGVTLNLSSFPQSDWIYHPTRSVITIHN